MRRHPLPCGLSHAARRRCSLPPIEIGCCRFRSPKEWPKPAYTRFRLGEGRGGGSRGVAAHACFCGPPPPPRPSPPLGGEGEEAARKSDAIALPQGGGEKRARR